ncbi:uncharacterized protein LOC107981940 [Nasonia vitripennis]|uniref:Uncharacterized protein n=1 Tax=Nasonia vitripennis TaxID=7425 RepID=A0A7M7J3N0_NASVI|nr:uncharacterized protein LOC107981940 [Nasonia vitripennis]
MLSFRFSSIVSFGLLCLTIVMISADEAPEVPKDPVEATAENGEVESNWSKALAYARNAFAYTSSLCIMQAAWNCKKHASSWKATKECLREQIEDHKSFCYTG